VDLVHLGKTFLESSGEALGTKFGFVAAAAAGLAMISSEAFPTKDKRVMLVGVATICII